jgi:cell wall-associated NlpC family hydrolase
MVIWMAYAFFRIKGQDFPVRNTERFTAEIQDGAGLRRTALSYLLCLALVAIFFGSTGNLAYADNVTVNHVQLKVLGNTLNVRSGPSTGGERIGQVHCGDILQAEAQSDNDWYKIDFHGESGWVAGWLVQDCQSSGNGQASAEASRGMVPGIISAAERLLGSPYRYGADGPYSFDCSGYTRYIFSLLGISLPHTASGQAQMGERVATPSPGDLVFFGGNGYIDHVGIYIGNNCFVSAANYRSGVTVSSINDFRPRYVEARRII